MNQVQEIKLELKMSKKDLIKIEKCIREHSYSLVNEYYGELIIDLVDKKEKSNLKQKFIKAITKKICEVYKVKQLSDIKWIHVVHIIMYVDGLTLDDLKQMI